jgi:hypothetical protein
MYSTFHLNMNCSATNNAKNIGDGSEDRWVDTKALFTANSPVKAAKKYPLPPFVRKHRLQAKSRVSNSSIARQATASKGQCLGQPLRIDVLRRARLKTPDPSQFSPRG